MSLQISDRVKALGAQAQRELTEAFARIDAVAETNRVQQLESAGKEQAACSGLRKS